MRIVNIPEERLDTFIMQAFAPEGMNRDSLAVLAHNAQICAYAPGETILLDGAVCTGAALILSGKVKLFKASQHGRELVVRLVGQGSIFNEVAAMDGGVNPVNASALEDTVLVMLHPTSIKQCLNMEPALAQRLLRETCRNMRSLMGLVEELSFYQITNRLARLLNRLPAEQLCGNVKQRMTQEELANHLGTVREVVARSLRELEKSGAIQVSRTGICIADRQILAVWAQAIEN